MTRRVLLIQAHPDAGAGHFGDALFDAYVSGARQARHEYRTLVLNQLEFGLIHSAAEWRDGEPPPPIAAAQREVRWAEHLVVFFPLWLGDMPALLKGFLEQLMRPDFAFSEPEGKFPVQLLKGRSARIVVTMGMPAFAYRAFYRSHSIKNLKRNILHFCGIRPVRASLVGGVEGSDAHRRRWLARIEALGREAR
ncbi:MAG: NAD(P)H-dependent oxidoreductase [Wenzhouxiangellaceae bacterium]